jgi:hypothetical protein
MSAAARFSYTATATVWPLSGRADWNGKATYGQPSQFPCDYSADSVRMTDAAGVEFTTRQVIFTERAGIKQGDMVLIGASAVADPLQAGAFEVRAVTRYNDTFERKADDFKVAT